MKDNKVRMEGKKRSETKIQKCKFTVRRITKEGRKIGGREEGRKEGRKEKRKKNRRGKEK